MAEESHWLILSSQSLPRRRGARDMVEVAGTRKAVLGGGEEVRKSAGELLYAMQKEFTWSPGSH